MGPDDAGPGTQPRPGPLDTPLVVGDRPIVAGGHEIVVLEPDIITTIALR